MKVDGQILLTPEIEVDTYWTSLADPAAAIIELYQDHGTSEQFHIEIKRELDLERLPSGKFATNDLVLHVGVMAYNIFPVNTFTGNFGGSIWIKAIFAIPIIGFDAITTTYGRKIADNDRIHIVPRDILRKHIEA